MKQTNVNVIKYSLKVWLTSVVAAPFLILTIVYCQDYSPSMDFKESILPGLCMCLVFIVFELIFSAVTWIVFTIVVGRVLSIHANGIQKTWIIFVAAILLTAGTCAVILVPFGFLENSSDLSFAALLTGSNCACIGFGVWFYKLKIPEPVMPFQNK
jgi:hypothetical protein